ncbi:Chloramphenicol acetyltransferase-like domain [Phaffia rhodozyma]|uniref:Chloramphenicol acetyltransferase-like domain n=1 Tax=Phaffia rhodozyma TaxID=264483 RepID=A0A0F7SEV7_PHARH|nr:Chloramphenicol acetyltransferase-like domain [Phaffia rhodozyma]
MTSIEERKLGLCERYSLSRSLISSEPAPIIAFTFSHPSVLSSQSILSNLQSATQTLVETHPVLFARFTDIHTLSPGLSRLKKISLEDVVVQVAESGSDTPEQDSFDSALVRMMTVDLQIESTVIPPWRIIWTRLTPMTGKAEDGTKVVVGFKGHHSLFDGLSAWTVAHSFSQSLSTLTLRPSGQTVYPSSGHDDDNNNNNHPCLPPSLESLISTKPSVGKIARIVLQQILRPLLPSPLGILSRLGYRPVDQPSIWTGDRSSGQPHPRKKHVRTITLSPDTVRSIVCRSRKRGVTLTAFLHAALTEAIQTLDPERRPLRTMLPVNLRPILSPTSPGLGGAYVAGITYDVPSPGDTPSQSGPAERSSDLWERAVKFNKWSKDRAVWDDAISDWGLLSLVSGPKQPAPTSSAPPPTGMVSFLKAKTEEPREHSLELSNLGSVRLALGSLASTSVPAESASTNTEQARWEPSRLVFTQAPLPISAALVLSVVGCEDLGGVEIAVGWEDGVVDREYIQQFQTRLETIVKRELEPID